MKIVIVSKTNILSRKRRSLWRIWLCRKICCVRCYQRSRGRCQSDWYRNWSDRKPYADSDRWRMFRHVSCGKPCSRWCQQRRDTFIEQRWFTSKMAQRMISLKVVDFDDRGSTTRSCGFTGLNRNRWTH